MSQVPIAAPRRNSEQKRLFEAFQRFSSNSVSDRQIELARACIKTANHYLLIPFQHIIDLNKVQLPVLLACIIRVIAS